ncbi:Uncharacterised protein [Mycobacteroides abscessus subsp. abscessus]|nr:Uncharacterised protein [Mycobacteroides abscessus subsp. abscessus]
MPTTNGKKLSRNPKNVKSVAPQTVNTSQHNVMTFDDFRDTPPKVRGDPAPVV